jgi:hypothetical protein
MHSTPYPQINTPTRPSMRIKRPVDSPIQALLDALSLLIGRIGIMNIMLLSVTQRTREVGVRLAVWEPPNGTFISNI